MFESPQAFLDFIQARGGNEQVMMLVFNNSYIKVYGDKESFNPDEDFDVTTGIFTFIEEDVKGRKFISYKTLEYIEGLTMAPIGVDKDTINYRNYRP